MANEAIELPTWLWAVSWRLGRHCTMTPHRADLELRVHIPIHNLKEEVSICFFFEEKEVLPGLLQPVLGFPARGN